MKVKHAQVVAIGIGLIALPVSHVLVSQLAPEGLPGHRVAIGGYLGGFCVAAVFLFMGALLNPARLKQPHAASMDVVQFLRDTPHRKLLQGLIVFFALLLILITHAFIVPTVPQRKLELLNQNMTQAEVLDLLGRPSRKLGPQEGAWHYSTLFRLGYVQVYFTGPSGNFHSYEYEE